VAPELILDEEGRLDLASVYSPFPKQDELHTSEATNLLAIGGNGSGKSAFLLGEAIFTICEYAGADVLLLRRDFRELDKGLILDFKNTVPRELYTYNDTKHVVTWCTGGHIFFGHLQTGSEKDLSQYLSDSFVFIGIDELGQFSYEAWSFLSSRNRVNKGCQASSRTGQMPIPRMGGATNPLGPGYGWIRQLWINRKPVPQMQETKRGTDGAYYQDQRGVLKKVFDPKEYHYAHSTILDNPAQLEKDPTYIEKLEKLPPPLRQKALYGDLESIAGSYFTNFTWERHVRSLPADQDEIQWQDWQPGWLSIDWGLAHWCAIYWHRRALIADRMTIDLPRDQWKWRNVVITYRERVVNEDTFAKTERADTDYHMLICGVIVQATPEAEREKIRFCFLSPDRFARGHKLGKTHTIAAEMSERMAASGLPRCARANDDRVDGAVFMYNLIDAAEWIILDSCPILIQALSTRVRDPKNLEDVLKVDGDQGDDAYDSARYGLLSMLKERKKPEEVKLAEKLATIPDHTSRMLYAYQHRLKEQEKHTGFRQKVMPRWMLKKK
jgi:hypothetical protein